MQLHVYTLVMYWPKHGHVALLGASVIVVSALLGAFVGAAVTAHTCWTDRDDSHKNDGSSPSTEAAARST